MERGARFAPRLSLHVSLALILIFAPKAEPFGAALAAVAIAAVVARFDTINVFIVIIVALGAAVGLLADADMCVRYC
jgi:hypothetical protein